MEFSGTYTPRLDDKGRLILPAKIREAFTDGIRITKGHEQCLHVYTAAEFRRQVAAKREVHSSDTQAGRDYMRTMLGSVADETVDKQGRVTIPPRLRTYAQLDRECTIIGVWDYLEVWSTELWEAREALLDQKFITPD